MDQPTGKHFNNLKLNKMNLIKFIFVILTCFFSNISYTQVFSFTNHIPKWSFITYDSTYEGHTEQGPFSPFSFNGSNHLIPFYKPLIYNDKVINIFTNQKNDFQGGFVDVRNLNDGSICWKFAFDLRTGTQREYPSLFQIDKDGNLELFCFRNILGDNYFVLWTEANLSYRKFDLKSGELLEHIFFEPSNPDGIHVGFYPGAVSLFQNEKNIDYISVAGNESFINTVTIKTFDNALNFIRDNSFNYMRKYKFYDANQPFLKQDEFTFSLRHSVSEISPIKPPSNYELILNKFDTNWNPMDSISLSEILDSATVYNYHGIQNSHHIFALRNNINQFTNENVKISILDSMYVLKETVELPNKRFRVYRVHKLPYDDGIIIISTVDNQPNIEIYKSDGNGNLNFLKTISAESNIVFPTINTAIINDRYLSLNMWVRELDQNGDIKEDKDKTVTTLFDLVELEILSNVKDISKNSKLKICPNPTTGVVRIQNLDSQSSVKIYNLSGSMVKSFENVTEQVNIEELPNGLYIFDIRNTKINERHKIIKVE